MASSVWHFSCWGLAGFGWGNGEIGPCLCHHLATHIYPHSSSLGKKSELKCTKLLEASSELTPYYLHLILLAKEVTKDSPDSRSRGVHSTSTPLHSTSRQSELQTIFVIYHRPVNRRELQNDGVLLIDCFSIFDRLFKFEFSF